VICVVEMAKGNRLPKVAMKSTKITEFDDFFDKNSEPMEQVVGWNNDLDDKLKELRAIGSDLRKESSETAPEPKGQVKVTIANELVSVSVEKDGATVPAKQLDKVCKEYLGMVEKKAKLLKSRIKTMQKLKGLENAVLRPTEKRPYNLEIAGDEEALKEHAKEDAITDMERSILKFNDRADLLQLQLNGPLTLGEAVSGLLNSIKEEFKKKGKEFKIAIEDGMPKIEGLPESVEDFFPKLVARGWELLNSILDFLKNLQDQIPGLQEKIEGAITESKEMPGKLKDAANGAGLSGMDLLKAGKATSANVKTLGGAPSTIAGLSKMLQSVGLEITGAVTGRLEGSGDGGGDVSKDTVPGDDGESSQSEKEDAPTE